MSDSLPCPKCHGQNTYSMGEIMTCPDCFHEWNPAELAEEAAANHEDYTIELMERSTTFYSTTVITLVIL
jgi:uncharacterized Zn ribbon protein